jgi:formylmethanofuran dehydrogenase subunit B
MSDGQVQTIANAVCQGCGCLCDDVEIDVAGGSVREIRHVCGMGRDWYAFQEQSTIALEATPIDPQAAEQAARLLRAARCPIIIGIERLPSEAQRLLVRLAERIGAVVATNDAPAILARQEVGEVTATLGEIRSRADLVVYWFCDPMRTHPRHLERYSSDGVGRFVPHGRPDRRLVVVGESPNGTRALADVFLPLCGDDEFAAIQELRLQVEKTDLGNDATRRADPSSPLETLAGLMKAAKYGALIVDPSRYRSSVPLESLFKLVRDLNDRTAFVVAPLGPGDNAKGAETLLQWLTGFPANVAMTDGVPTYDAGAWSTEELCRRRRPDAALIVGGSEELRLSTAAVEHLRRIPVVQLGGATGGATVRLPIKTSLASEGTVFRMDGVPLPNRAALNATRASAEAVINGMIDALPACPIAGCR